MKFKQLLLVLLFGVLSAPAFAQPPAEMMKNFCQETGAVITDCYGLASGSIPGLVITNATIFGLIALEMKMHHYKDFSWANFKEVYRKAMDRSGEYKMFLFLCSSLVAFDTKVLVYDPIKMIFDESTKKERLENEEKERAHKEAEEKALNEKIDNELEYKKLKLEKDEEIEKATDKGKAQLDADIELQAKRKEFKKMYEKERRDENDRKAKEQDDRLKAAQKEAQIQSELVRAKQLAADADLRKSVAFNTNVNTGLDIVNALLPQTTTVRV